MIPYVCFQQRVCPIDRFSSKAAVLRSVRGILPHFQQFCRDFVCISGDPILTTFLAIYVDFLASEGRIYVHTPADS